MVAHERPEPQPMETDMKRHTTPIRPIVAIAAALVAVACNGDAQPKTADDCGPEDDIERGADTAGEGIKTGAVAVAEGVDTFGSSAVEFFKGGSDAASEEWDEEAADTDAKVRSRAAKTRSTARDKHCR